MISNIIHNNSLSLNSLNSFKRIFSTRLLQMGMAFSIAVAGATYTPEANALAEPRLSDIPLLENALYLTSIQGDLYRYKAAMVVIANTHNREDFLINRDELWSSREELSFSSQNLAELKDIPYATENKKISDDVRVLLQECENYANNQNELISISSKLDTAKKDIVNAFKNIRDVESIIGKRSLSPNEDELFIQLSNARSVYETLIFSLLEAKSSVEIDDLVKQVNNSFNSYSELMIKSSTVFPELAEVYNENSRAFSKIFENKGIGTEYYKYVQKKEIQDEIEAIFNKSLKDLNKQIRLTQAKIRQRLGL